MRKEELLLVLNRIADGEFCQDDLVSRCGCACEARRALDEAAAMDKTWN